MSFASEHASVHADIAANGQAAVFTQSATSYDETTGRNAQGAASVSSGVAIQTKGNVATYDKLGLLSLEVLTLFYVTDDYGGVPPKFGMSISWTAGNPFLVKNVEPFAPDGAAIFSYVIIAR